MLDVEPTGQRGRRGRRNWPRRFQMQILRQSCQPKFWHPKGSRILAYNYMYLDSYFIAG